MRHQERMEGWELALVEDRSWSREEASRALSALSASGKTVAAFARDHGSTSGRFLYWRRRLGEETHGGGRLLPMRVVKDGQSRLVEREPGRVVVLSGEARVEIEGMPAEWVASLIRLLREREG